MRTLAFILTLALAAATQAATVILSDGTRHEGQITSVTANELLVKTDKAQISVPLKDLRTVTGLAATDLFDIAGNHVLATEDGSTVVIKDAALADGKLTATSRAGKLTVEAEKITRILRPRPAQTPADILKLRDKAKLKRGDKDAVLVQDAGADVTLLTGIVQSLGEQLVINYEGADTNLPAANIPLIEFATLAAAPAGAATIGDVILADGSHIAFTAVTGDATTLTVTSPSLGKLQVPLTSFGGIKLRSTAAVTHLSDLAPATDKHTPFFGAEAPRPNLAVPQKSLLLRAKTERSYNLAGQYKTLSLTASIHSATPHGKATLTILADDKSLKTATLAGNDKPLTIDLDLKNVKTLRIVVDAVEGTFGSGANVLLTEPVLTK